MKHTPGPWVYNKETKWVEKGGIDICSIDFTSMDPHDIANAQLIAAAPELLEALNNAREFIDYLRFEVDQKDDDLNGKFTESLMEVNEAIAKAKGES